jgi:hypothetical protein
MVRNRSRGRAARRRTLRRRRPGAGTAAPQGPLPAGPPSRRARSAAATLRPGEPQPAARVSSTGADSRFLLRIVEHESQIHDRRENRAASRRIPWSVVVVGGNGDRRRLVLDLHQGAKTRPAGMSIVRPSRLAVVFGGALAAYSLSLRWRCGARCRGGGRLAAPAARLAQSGDGSPARLCHAGRRKHGVRRTPALGGTPDSSAGRPPRCGDPGEKHMFSSTFFNSRILPAMAPAAEP